jgi:predicted nucleotidyltransferase
MEATQIRFLCSGLEIFEALDIVKHENRRQLLGMIKTTIEKDEFKIKDILYLVRLYPSKIRTKAVEQLVEIAIQKILEQNLLPNIDHQLIFIAQLTKQGVSPKI